MISFHETTNKVLSVSSNYILVVVIWLNFSYFRIFMTDDIINEILYGFDYKNRFFRGWSWFKFNNLRLVLGMVLTFYSWVEKSQKSWEELARSLFALHHARILNRVESKLKDSRPVKTIEKERYRFYSFISCSVEVTFIITTLILENMFRVTINLRGIGEWQLCMFADAWYQPP